MRLLYLLIICTIFAHANDRVDLQRFYIKDQNRSMQIKEILHTKKWQSLNKNSDAFRETHSQIWVKLLFSNQSNSKEKIIELPNLYRGQVFLYDSNGTLTHRYGHNLPFHAMSFFYPNISIPLIVPHGKSIFYLAVTSDHELNLKTDVWNIKNFKRHISMMLIFLGAYFSGMLLLIFYNAIFYLFSREKVFLYYVLYTSIMVITMVFSTGVGFMLLWPNYPQMNQYTGVTFYFLTLVLGLIFSREFLQTKKFLHKADKVMLYAIYIGLAIIIISNFVTVGTIIKLLLFFNFTSFILMLVAALYIAIVFKELGARLVVAGWSALVVGVSVSLLGYLQIIKGNFWTHIGAEIGTFVEITFFSVALASRYRDKRIALIESQNELKKINENLGKRVEQKTRALSNTNEKLQKEVTLNNQLLRELTHRVKNNLQVILSFLSLQIKSSTNQELNSMLEESRRRVRAIVAVHEHLIATRQFEQISMDAYFKELLDQNTKIFQHLHVHVKIDMHGITLPIQTATLIGLIVNEIFNNACKYAFNYEKEPIFRIWMYKKDETYELEVGDNGRGLCDPDEDSLGMKIIAALIKQLNGSYEIVQDRGVAYIIRFKIVKENEKDITQDVT